MSELLKLDTNKRLAYFLPNFFTALNMACGFVAMTYALTGRYYEACMLLILGGIFDLVDGRVARLTGTQSNFGEQFDSLSDLLTFGVAPAFLFYTDFLKNFGRLGIIAAFMFILCGALRLARFNANIEKVSSDYFQGLPIPSAAMGLVGYLLISQDFSYLREYKPVAIAYVLFFAVLMVSSIPFPSFKKSEWVKKNKRVVFLIVMTIFASVFIYEQLMIAVIIWVYVIGSLIYYFMHRNRFKGIFDIDSDSDREKA